MCLPLLEEAEVEHLVEGPGLLAADGEAADLVVGVGGGVGPPLVQLPHRPTVPLRVTPKIKYDVFVGKYNKL